MPRPASPSPDEEVLDLLADVPLTKREPLAPPREEFVVQPNREVRQAGATHADGQWIKQIRVRAERSLYVFVRSVLDNSYLVAHLHLPICNFLQTTPPYRKMLRAFRESGKTSIGLRGVPLHIHIQPEEHNLYFPGEAGCEQRSVLIGESERRSMDSLSVVRANCESNELMRALWPHLFWENPDKQASKWNDRELVLPRAIPSPWADPSLRAIGVGGAIAGSHPSSLFKDDTVTFEAANSPTVMQTVIDWHIASRAMINRPGCLEFIFGTRWHIWDIYAWTEENDPTMETLRVPLLDAAGNSVFPEVFTPEKIAQIRLDTGVLFPLQYLDCANDPSLTDFAARDVRLFSVADDKIVFEEEARDVALAEVMHAPSNRAAPDLRGLPVNDETLGMIKRRREDFLRFRA